MNDMQTLYNMIAILTEKLGGNVVITQDEVEHPPEGTVTRDDVARTLTLKTERHQVE